VATSGRRRTRGYEAPVGAYVSGRSESVECRQPQQIWSIERQGNEQVPNEGDSADFCADRTPKQPRSAWFPHWSPSRR
jgi:hypothetical protein